ncbi:DUF6968 family protein [Neisseria wadsworthii]|uniref:DUF6968 domain-containing protein n=1 Tax=Neisseria wadsworthii 9715 TaxID=1030841 RepID=G4CQW6_9NEIS|nr:hypothetical protein [Neisseria wadsworthii]EGZ45971.1 hypothetical protein HMPREF9370_1476 [Neisseria wadsworthii 9715]QMT35200.1 hypothetical protein H3L96_09060 [Neisseria wadsworthii]
MAERLNIDNFLLNTVRSKLRALLNQKVEIFIAKPEKVQEDEWICRYRILGPGEDMNFQVHGIDSVQALRCVFRVIDSAIIGADLSFALVWRKRLGGFYSRVG